MFKTERTTKASPKSEITERKILEAALYLFRTKGFDEATMRDIAAAAEVATGAAYYYYPSKDAIVLAFYQRSCDEMQPRIADAVGNAPGNLEESLKALIQAKLDYFAPYRTILRALLKNGADPAHPLSPFAANNKSIRETDAAWFQKVLEKCRLRLPKDLQTHMPDALWMFQMGVIYFWVTDDSAEQRRTNRVLALGANIVATLLKIAGLPLTRPLCKVVIQLIETVKHA
ncbi:MAG TPA: TetR family transcriptional regulator [Candidatus Acidoferrales bacterium]|nr:TetR family transcriptional regulator [Candidatus Acidoferrales bacterium]